MIGQLSRIELGLQLDILRAMPCLVGSGGGGFACQSSTREPSSISAHRPLSHLPLIVGLRSFSLSLSKCPKTCDADYCSLMTIKNGMRFRFI